MTLTYVKALPTPTAEQTPLFGLTLFEQFLYQITPIIHRATCETVNRLLVGGLDENEWRKHLQVQYKVNARYARGIISRAKALVESARACRREHIKGLERKLGSACRQVESWRRELKLGRKFYRKKNWRHSKTGCPFPLMCDPATGKSNWHQLRFNIHHKQRYIAHLERKIAKLKAAPVRVKVPKRELYLVGCKSESFGNLNCQWDKTTGKLRIRVPECLESAYGEYVETELGDFDRKVDRLPESGARTWHFFLKEDTKGLRWHGAVQFTPKPVAQVSRPVQYGCIGIDLNPTKVGWAYVDHDGNLKAKGQIPLNPDLPRGQQQAQMVSVCLQLVALAREYACPLVVERLDFGAKKATLREKSHQYARMLSGWAYRKFYELLTSMTRQRQFSFAANRGVRLVTVNPAYSSVVGLVKFLRMYGLSDAMAAALVLARRAMKLSERLPR